MTVKTALDGVEAILGIIAKGDADPSVKLVAIRKLAETLRNDIQDLTDAEYSNYIEGNDEPEFDMAEAVAMLHEKLSKRDFNELYSYYDIDAIRFVDDRPAVRVAMAKALLQIAAEVKRDANPAWEGIVSVEGFIGDEE